jgi:thiol-disulfide isomerase/thioredoxin
MKNIFLLVSLSIVLFQLQAQSIKGNFPSLKGQLIHLFGFKGIKTYCIDSAKVTENGEFILKYLAKDYGMGYISDSANKIYMIVLEKDSILIKGETLASNESIITLKGCENINFERYAIDHSKREQVLRAWKYLEKIYSTDTLFLNQGTAIKSIAKEIKFVEAQDNDFISHLPNSTYIGWYLQLRRFLSLVPTIAQYSINKIPATLATFRNIKYDDSRLYKSGLLSVVLENQFWLIENMGLPLDTVFKEMNVSAEIILEGVLTNEGLFNEVTNFLFDYFEKHSLFKVSEYLALKAMNQKVVLLSPNLLIKLEGYLTMKKGNIAPEITFTGDIIKKGDIITKPSRLSEINSQYKVVIFGASWCSACSEEMAQLLLLYDKWKARGLEVLFVSLDTDQKVFKDYTSVLPFISFCDYKKWDTQAAKDYYVFSSPTIFLLNQKNKILLKVPYIRGIDTWVDYGMKTD